MYHLTPLIPTFLFQKYRLAKYIPDASADGRWTYPWPHIWYSSIIFVDPNFYLMKVTRLITRTQGICLRDLRDPRMNTQLKFFNSFKKVYLFFPLWANLWCSFTGIAAWHMIKICKFITHFNLLRKKTCSILDSLWLYCPHYVCAVWNNNTDNCNYF